MLVRGFSSSTPQISLAATLTQFCVIEFQRKTCPIHVGSYTNQLLPDDPVNNFSNIFSSRCSESGSPGAGESRTSRDRRRRLPPRLIASWIRSLRGPRVSSCPRAWDLPCMKFWEWLLVLLDGPITLGR